MDPFQNRLVGKTKYPDDAFFFGYDYWEVNEEGDVVSVADGSYMPDHLLRRFKDS